MAQQEVDLEQKLRLEAELQAEIIQQQMQQTNYPPLKKVVDDLEREMGGLNQDFFSSDNAVKKIPQKKITNCSSRKGSNYSPTKVKVKNFLTKVSYNRVKEVDYETFLLLNLNPFYLERKFESVLDREYVETLWSMLLPNDLYAFICQPEHYKILNKINSNFHEATEIVKSFADESSRFEQLKHFLRKNARAFQFVYANLFPRYFSRVNDYGIQSRLEFDNVFKTLLSQRNMLNWYSMQNSNIKTDEEEVASIEANPSTPINDEEISIKKETVVETVVETDGTAKEKIKIKRKIKLPSEKKLKMCAEKKKQT